MDRATAPTLRDDVIEAVGETLMPVADLRVLLGPPWVDRGAERDELDRLLQLDPTFTEAEARSRAQHIAGFEQRWLDESIPALGGRTPARPLRIRWDAKT